MTLVIKKTDQLTQYEQLLLYEHFVYLTWEKVSHMRICPFCDMFLPIHAMSCALAVAYYEAEANPVIPKEVREQAAKKKRKLHGV